MHYKELNNEELELENLQTYCYLPITGGQLDTHTNRQFSC